MVTAKPENNDGKACQGNVCRIVAWSLLTALLAAILIAVPVAAFLL